MTVPTPAPVPGQPDPDVLLVGCGDLGADVGLRLARRGHRVAGLRRRADLVPAPLVGVAADLTEGTPTLPPLDLGLLVVALTARPRSEEAYRATYVDGLARALDALEAADQAPRRAVLVSSTGVMGDVGDDEPLTEDTLPEPADGPARMLLESERVFAARVPGGVVLRLSGLYGRSTYLQDKVRRGEVDDPHRWTNRIHRSDAASAVVHLLTTDLVPDPLYLGTDDEPALLGDVASFLADRLDAPRPPAADPALAHGKRLSNARLRSTGWVPEHPTFREGYADVGTDVD